MSNRFHSKWHRTNHHTYSNDNNPDTGHDPIASQRQPFIGEFVLSGALSAVAPLSAFAGYFYSNYTAICAVAGTEGLFVTAPDRGMQIFSDNLAISAYSSKLGISVASPIRAISANSAFIGLDIFSQNKAISARGLKIGLEVSSPMVAISAFSNYIAAELYSLDRALSAFGYNLGIEVASNNVALSAYGKNIGLEVASNNRAISAIGLYMGGEFYSNNIALSAFGRNIGLEVASNTRAISAHGITLGIESYSENIALSAYGSAIGLKVESAQKAIQASGNDIGLEVRSNNIGLSSYGTSVGGEFYSTNIPLSTAYGKNLLHGVVGININTPTSALQVLGDSYLDGHLRVTQNGRVDGNLTIMGNLSTMGDITYLDTMVNITSAVEITNIGTGPALLVTQTGDNPIAKFYDDAGAIALYVEGSNAKPGWVGVGTATPNVEFTVNGSISASGTIYANHLKALSATISGPLSAGSLGVYGSTVLGTYLTDSVVASGTIYSNELRAVSATITGPLSAGSLTVFGNTLLGDTTGDSVIASGMLTAETLDTLGATLEVLDAANVNYYYSSLPLPVTANVIALSGNTPAISAITGGSYGAVYYIINSLGSNITFTHSTGLYCRGASPLVLGPLDSATLICRNGITASIH